MVVAEWTNSDGSLDSAYFRSWREYSKWLPPPGLHGVSVHEERDNGFFDDDDTEEDDD